MQVDSYLEMAKVFFQRHKMIWAVCAIATWWILISYIIPPVGRFFLKSHYRSEEKMDAYYAPLIEKEKQNFIENYFKRVEFTGAILGDTDTPNHGRYYEADIQLKSSKNLNLIPTKYRFIKYNPQKNILHLTYSGYLYEAGGSPAQHSPSEGDKVEKKEAKSFISWEFIKSKYHYTSTFATSSIDKQFDEFFREIVEKEHPYP